MACCDFQQSSNTYWDFREQPIDKTQALKIAKELKQNDKLKRLKLAGHQIGVPGAMALANALKGKTGLESLDLNDMRLGEDAAAAFAEALVGNMSLKDLCLRGNYLGAKGAEAFAKALQGNTSLARLDLTHNHIGPKGAQAFATALKDNTKLKMLFLRDNAIGVQGVKALAEALKRNRSLFALSIKENLIGDEGAQLLAGMLKDWSSLKILHLNKNGITATGVEAFAKALADSASLQELDFRDNGIGPEGVKALTTALEGNTSLRYLHFSAHGDESTDLLSQVQTALERNKIGTQGPQVLENNLQSAPAAELQHEKKGPLLDQSIQSLRVSYPCVLAWHCPGHTENLDDNERGPCDLHISCIQCKYSQAVSDAGLEQVDIMSLRDFYYSNRNGKNCPSCQANVIPLQLHVVCHYCKQDPPKSFGPANERPSFIVNCSDTIQTFYLHLRDIVCNDLSSFEPAYPNFEQLKKAGIRAEPMELCHLLSGFNQVTQTHTAVCDKNIQKIATSLENGALGNKLEEKMANSKEPTSTYLRIGLVHQLCFGKHTAVLELWPEGHTSPIHQHGGCAGAIYVVSGKLRVEVFRSLVDQTVIHDATIEKGSYAFIDRVNFSTHRVSAVVEQGDKYRFALSIHLYKSCTDEFEFIRDGVAQKSNPINDFVWLYYVEDKHDPRVTEVDDDASKDFRRHVLLL